MSNVIQFPDMAAHIENEREYDMEELALDIVDIALANKLPLECQIDAVNRALELLEIGLDLSNGDMGYYTDEH